MRRIPLLLTLCLLLLTTPPTAHAATYDWDETTGTLDVTVQPQETGLRVEPGWHGEPDALFICGNEDPSTCPNRYGVTQLTVHFTAPGQAFAVISDHALRADSATPIQTTLDGLDASTLYYKCSPPKSPTHPCSITGTGNTLDLNADGTPDITLSGTRLANLQLYTGAGNDVIDLRRVTFPIRPNRDHRGQYGIHIDAGAGNDRILTGATRDSVLADLLPHE